MVATLLKLARKKFHPHSLPFGDIRSVTCQSRSVGSETSGFSPKVRFRGIHAASHPLPWDRIRDFAKITRQSSAQVLAIVSPRARELGGFASPVAVRQHEPGTIGCLVLPVDAL